MSSGVHWWLPALIYRHCCSAFSFALTTIRSTALYSRCWATVSSLSTSRGVCLFFVVSGVGLKLFLRVHCILLPLTSPGISVYMPLPIYIVGPQHQIHSDWVYLSEFLCDCFPFSLQKPNILRSSDPLVWA